MRIRFLSLIIFMLISASVAIAQTTALDFLNRGNERRANEDLSGAIADYTKAIELDPKFADAYYRRGSARHWAKDYDGAIADYTKVIELKPKYPYAYHARGLARHAKNDFDGAIADYTKNIKRNRKHTESYYSRGLARESKKNYYGAIADFTKAIKLNPVASFYLKRAETYRKAGKVALAEADERRAAELKGS